MSLVSTLAKVAVGVALAKGASYVAQNGLPGARTAGAGGGSVGGGGLADMMGGLLGGGSAAGAGGGLGGLLEQLSG
ncbi:MAG: tellurite resistance TerB family protein, partial [Pseudorhodobacter sp.]|nr:tellurite resistance TerB family protein [Pseudorhodobacter sp.]